MCGSEGLLAEPVLGCRSRAGESREGKGSGQSKSPHHWNVNLLKMTDDWLSTLGVRISEAHESQ